MADFICPVCGLPLNLSERVFRCGNNHCFDKSKYGYVNLLRSNSSSAKRHGDDRLMIRARRDFLSKGYYSFLLDELCEICGKYAPDGALLIDAGCGECYYSSSILKRFPSYSAIGADISKDALEFAHKKGVTFPLCVASIFEMPFESGKADIILIKVVPLEEHLFSLKSAVYEKPYPNEKPDTAEEGFELLEFREIRRDIYLNSNEDIMNLFRMTPYYYKTGREDQQKAEALDEITVCAAFGIAVYRKAR